MKVRLLEIGRSKITKEVDVKGYSGILDEVKKYLMSSEVWLSGEDGEHEMLTVNAGFHTVGHVEILDSRVTVDDILKDNNELE